MYINHFETCGICHTIHTTDLCPARFRKSGDSCAPELIGQPQIIGNFGIGIKFGSNSPDDLRKLGFSVAIHNDYKLHGIDYTFWLFIKLINDQLIAVIGEGISDIIALDIVREQILRKNLYEPKK